MDATIAAQLAELAVLKEEKRIRDAQALARQQARDRAAAGRRIIAANADTNEAGSPQDLQQCSVPMRPKVETVCPLGDNCQMQHYVQDATLLEHFKGLMSLDADEQIMLLQHVLHDLERENTERFTEDAREFCTCDKGPCLCDGACSCKPCSIKVG
jgi:hypothetical protein